MAWQRPDKRKPFNFKQADAICQPAKGAAVTTLTHCITCTESAASIGIALYEFVAPGENEMMFLWEHGITGPCQIENCHKDPPRISHNRCSCRQAWSVFFPM
jgi:hypothetical protein